MKSRRFILAVAPLCIVGAIALSMRATAAPPSAPEKLLPPDRAIPTLTDPEHINSRRRGILIPRRVKEILSYNKTALA